jgi:phage major head subunit gpT-like protein
MQINQQSLASVFTGFQAAFNKGFESAPSVYRDIAMIVPSTTREETYGWLGQFPKMREWLGDRIVRNLSLHGYTIKNRDFEETIGVDRNDIDDDKFGVYAPMFQEMGKAAAELPDELTLGLLGSGFTTLCYDGQYFFDTDHPVGNGEGDPVSISNTQGGAGEAWYLLDTTRALRPLVFQERKPLGTLVRKDAETDESVFMRRQFLYGSNGRCNVGFGLWQLAYASKQDLTADNYEAARKAMANLVGDEGRPLNIKPNVLVCGPNNEGAAMRLLNNGTRIVSVDNGGGTTTPVAVQNEWAKTAKPIVTQWLNAA